MSSTGADRHVRNEPFYETGDLGLPGGCSELFHTLGGPPQLAVSTFRPLAIMFRETASFCLK